MTLGNMRANGVRTLAAWCLGRGLNYSGSEQLIPMILPGDLTPMANLIPTIPASRLKAPTVLFVTFEIFETGVLDFE